MSLDLKIKKRRFNWFQEQIDICFGWNLMKILKSKGLKIIFSQGFLDHYPLLLLPNWGGKKIFQTFDVRVCFRWYRTCMLLEVENNTTQKVKFSIKDFFGICDQICGKLRIWSHLLKKILVESYIFCALNNAVNEVCLAPCQIFVMETF